MEKERTWLKYKKVAEEYKRKDLRIRQDFWEPEITFNEIKMFPNDYFASTTQETYSNWNLMANLCFPCVFKLRKKNETNSCINYKIFSEKI